VRLDILVRPNASVTKVGGAHDGALVVRVASPPEHGKATRAALDALARALALPRSSVTLVRGATSRRKVVTLEVASSEEPDVARHLDRLRQGPAPGR
jgi:uncharacterized protein YggU (UPF0235/DUF167 family)